MKKVFVLQHAYENSGENDNAKLIGVYSTEKKGLDAITRLKQEPGFREHPEGFVLDEYTVDKDYWAEGFVQES